MVRRRLPPPNWLRTFEAAARHLSFTDAAHELNITQSAVSQHVRLLEQHLKEPLFNRFPRRLELTDTGRAYLPAVREAFDRLAKGTEELFGDRERRLLTVKVNVAFAALCLAPRLQSFCNRHPGVELRLLNAIWLTDPDWESTDLEIRHGRGGWRGLQEWRLTRDTLFPVCAPALLQGTAALRRPQDLAGHTLLHGLATNDGWGRWLEAAGVDGPVTSTTLQFDTFVVACAAAATGGGVALARASLVAGDLESGRLVRPFDVEIPAEESFFLVRPEDRPESVQTRAFREWLLEEYASSESPIEPS
jgi:LysR family glycine cleavage system transcriptional activator